MDDLNRPAPSSTKDRLSALTSPNWASKTLVFLLIIASVLVIVTMGLSLVSKRQDLIKQEQYQAVFLNNGQVYFGKLRGASSEYLRLQDVFYLQQNNQVQQPQDQNQSQSDNNLSLVRLGNELHGPENEMFIARDQILFWENLKDDGKVVQAIKGNQTQP